MTHTIPSKFVEDPNPAPAMCLGKSCYPSHAKALQIVRARHRLFALGIVHGRRTPLKVYRCDVCHMWHLATPRRDPQDIKRQRH